MVSKNGNGGTAANGNGHVLHEPGLNGKNGRAAPRGRSAHGQLRYAHVVGWGMKVPDAVITNFDLEAVVDTTDEWIRKGTGIEERRIANDRESTVTLGFEAARAALDRADVLPTDIQLIIVATSTPEEIYPSCACKIQNLLGATHAGAFDLSAACSGFVYGMNMAAQAIRSGSIETALVIGAEVNSRVLDWSDRATCILFGDGAGAVVLQASDEPGGLMSCVLGSDGSGAELLGIPTVGYAVVPEGKQMHKIYMNGREVFRFATHIMNESIRDAVSQAHLSMSDIALIVPHQANLRIINAAARSLGVPESLFYSNLQRYGNTSAASIPIALCEAERDKRIKPNDNIVLVGFGGGLTWASAVIQWQGVPRKVPVGIPFRVSQGRREAQYIFAFWRARIMRTFRRVEAFLKGPPTKTSDVPTLRADARRSLNGNGDQRSRLPDKVAEKVEKAASTTEPEKTAEHN